jgi:hypothetical protein
MVFIKNVENLTVEFNIVGSISYDIDQERVGIKFDLKVRHNGESQHKNFGVAVTRDEVQKVKETFEQNKVAVNAKLDEIKEKIKPLLNFSETVEVPLDDVAEQLLEVARNGLEEKIKKKELEEIARRTRRRV